MSTRRNRTAGDLFKEAAKARKEAQAAKDAAADLRRGAAHGYAADPRAELTEQEKAEKIEAYEAQAAHLLRAEKEYLAEAEIESRNE